MKKLLYVILALIIILIAAVLLTPSFIDVNKYKSEVISQFKAATGYEMTIKGEVKLSLFPKVQVVAKDISIFNGTTNLVNIEQITAYPLAKTLFSEQVKIDSIKVERPIVSLGKTEAGNNWDMSPITSSLPGIGKKLDMQITSMEIIDGKLDYADKVKDKTYNFSNMNFKTNIMMLKGPLGFDGSMKYNDLDLSAKGTIQNFATPKFSITTKLLNSEIFYDGSLQTGKFSVKSTDIQPLADFLELASWAKQLEKKTVDVAGEINYSKEKIDLRNLKISVGNTSGEGDLSSTLGDKLAIIAKMKFKTLDLDQLMPGKIEGGKKEDTEKSKDQHIKEISAELDISADSVIFGAANYKNLSIKATSESGSVSLQPFSIDFPKSGKAEMFGVLSDDSQGRVFEGHLTANSDNLGEILKSFKVNIANLKPGSFQNFKFDSEVIVNLREHPSADLSDSALTLDDSLFKGNIALDFNDIPRIGLNGTINALDMDKYLVADVPPPPVTGKQGTAPTEDKPYRIEWLEKLPVKGNLNVLIGKVTYDKEPYSNLRLRANFKPDNLEIDEASASGRKIQFSAQGAIYTFAGKKPKFNIKANLGKINLADFIPVDPNATAAPRPQDKSRWAKEPFNLSFLRKMDMDFTGNILSFTHGKYVFDNMAVKAYVEDGKFVVEKASGNLFGGKIEANGNVEASAVPSVAIAALGNGVDINKLLDAVTDNKRVSGKVNFSGSVAASGIYQLAMMTNLTGSLSFLSNNLVIRGFDIDGMSQQLTNTNNVTDVISIARTVAGEEAVTYLKAVDGIIVFENGGARQQGKGIKINATGGQGLYSGNANLVNWSMDTNAIFQINTPDRKAKPELGIHIYGAIDEPKKDVNLDAIKRYISNRRAKQLLNGN